MYGSTGVWCYSLVSDGVKTEHILNVCPCYSVMHMLNDMCMNACNG